MDQSPVHKPEPSTEPARLVSLISLLEATALRVASLLVLSRLPEDDPVRSSMINSMGAEFSRERHLEFLTTLTNSSPEVAAKIVQPAVATGMKIQLSREEKVAPREGGPEIIDLTGTWNLYRFPEPGLIDFCFDMRAADPFFKGDSISEGLTGTLEMERDPEGVRPGDIVILNIEGRRVYSEVEKIRKDPTTYLPYYEASGTVLDEFS